VTARCATTTAACSFNCSPRRLACST
jgi:hypothetical protein